LQQAAANFTLLFHFLFLSPSLMVPYMSLTSMVRDLSSGLLPQRYHRFALIGYVVILSIPGVIFMSGIMISNIVGIWRYWRAQQSV